MRKYLICGLLLAAMVTWELTDRVRAQADAGAPAKDAGPPVAVEPVAAETVDRIYDVRDLVRFVQNYPLTGGPTQLTQLGEAASNAGQAQQQPPQQQGLFQQQSPAPAQQEKSDVSIGADALQRLITLKIDKKSWVENGGNVGTIDWFDGLLVVTQTDANQQAIQKLLDELRAGRNHMVRVRADWVLLPPGQVEKLQKNGGDDKSPVPEIGRDLLSALPKDTVHYSGSIVCFSGQTVNIVSGRAKSLVTGLSAQPNWNTTDMTPTVTFIQEGLSLQVTATVTGDSATLDLASIVTEPNKFVQRPATQPAIDRLDSDLQHFHTTLQVPVNKAVLVAGATSDPNEQEPAGKQLHLIIEADSAKYTTGGVEP